MKALKNILNLSIMLGLAGLTSFSSCKMKNPHYEIPLHPSITATKENITAISSAANAKNEVFVDFETYKGTREWGKEMKSIKIYSRDGNKDLTSNDVYLAINPERDPMSINF